MTDLKINDVRPRLQILQTDPEARSFDLPFAVLSGDHLKVAIDDGAPNEVAFTVDRLNETDGARLTLASAPPVGARISIWRDMPVERVTDFLDDGTFRASALNRELDRLAMLLQQAEARAEESLRVAPSDLERPLLLPPAAERAGRILSFDADGAPATPAALNALDVVAANLQDLRNYADTYLGAADAAPGARHDGAPLEDGDLYYDRLARRLMVYDATLASWIVAYTTASDYVTRDGAVPMTGALEAPDVLIGGASVWHPGNQGAGSGLDADRLDGSEADAFASATELADLSGRMDEVETRLALNTVRDVVASGWSVLDMVDGVADAFVDASGVDAALSTNADYDAAAEFYAPQITLGTPDQPVPAGVWTVGGGDSPSNGAYTPSGNNGGGYTSGLSFAGDFAVRAVLPSSGNIPNVGVVDAPSVGSLILTDSSGNANMDAVANSYYQHDSGTASKGAYRGATRMLAAAFAAGDALTIQRVGGVLSFLRNDAPFHSFATTFSGAMRLVIAHPNGSIGAISSLLYTESGARQDMTLVSTAQTAGAAPASARIVLIAEPVDSILLNTDLLVDASRDDGVTWSAGVLSDVAAYDASARVYASDPIDLSGQPAGTAMRLRLRTANAKDIRVHAWTLQWS